MMAGWRTRLRETHGVVAELTRHFFLRLFDTDLVSAPGQLQKLVIGIFGALYAFAIMAPVTQFRKYSELPLSVTPEQFHSIAESDRLAFLVFPMAVVAMAVVLEWQSLFPSRQDSLILLPLPISRVQLFTAKFAALLLFVAIFAFAGGLAPVVVLPAVQSGPLDRAPVPLSMAALAVAALAGCLFTFSSLLALQGLVVLLPQRIQTRLSLTLHATLLLALLCALPQILNIAGLYRRQMLPDWFPPLWFLGIAESLTANPGARFHAWARSGWLATAASMAAACLLYAAGYFRQTAARLETPSGRPHRWAEPLLRALLARQPMPRFAVASFVLKTLARSRQHKLLLSGYLGLGLAILANSAVLVFWLDPLRRSPDQVQEGIIGFSLSLPLVLSFFLISGLRVVLSIPAALEANWLFRLLEDDGARRHWLGAVEAVFYGAAIVPSLALAVPSAWLALGWRAVLWHLPACALLSLTLVELMLWEWHKVPFVCSYVPGQRNASVVFVAYWFFFALFAYTTTEIESWCLREPWRMLVFLGVALVCYAQLRLTRLRRALPQRKLLFEDREIDAFQLLRLENT